LLELSGGTRGLREVYLDLINKYGKDKPFNNEDFFDILIEMTYPEIEEFINNYIIGTSPLPYEQYFEKLGIEYTFSRPSEDIQPIFGIHIGSPDGEHLSINGCSREYKDFGLKKGDAILSVFGEEVSLSNANDILERKNKMKPGDTFEVTIKREDEELTFIGTLFAKIDYHIFSVYQNCTNQQNELRSYWSNYLISEEIDK